MAKINPAEIFDYLTGDKGLSAQHALGILNNIQHESGFDPNINEKKPLVKGSRGGYGLFQHTGSRRRELEKNEDHEDWRTQIDFALSEREGKAFANKEFNSAEEASIWFTENFERPANKKQRARERAKGLTDGRFESLIDGYRNISRSDETRISAFNGEDDSEIPADDYFNSLTPVTKNGDPIQLKDSAEINSEEDLTASLPPVFKDRFPTSDTFFSKPKNQPVAQEEPVAVQEQALTPNNPMFNGQFNRDSAFNGDIIVGEPSAQPSLMGDNISLGMPSFGEQPQAAPVQPVNEDKPKVLDDDYFNSLTPIDKDGNPIQLKASDGEGELDWDSLTPVEMQISQPMPTEAESGAGFGDFFVGTGQGVLIGSKMLTDVFGVDNAVSKTLEEGVEWFDQFYSEGKLNQDLLDAKERMELGEDASMFDRVALAFQQTLRNPAMIGQQLGIVAPMVAGGALGVGSRGVAFLAAAQGAGAVKSGIYDNIQSADEAILLQDPNYAQMRENGMSEAQAKEAYGITMQSYGENALPILASSMLAVGLSRIGAERLLGELGDQAGLEALKEAAKQYSVKGVAKTTGKEIGTEMVEEPAQTIASNIGAGRGGAGFEDLEGVPEAIGSAAAGSILPSGGMAAWGAKRADSQYKAALEADKTRKDIQQDADSALNEMSEAKTVDDLLNAAERATNSPLDAVDDNDLTEAGIQPMGDIEAEQEGEINLNDIVEGDLVTDGDNIEIAEEDEVMEVTQGVYRFVNNPLVNPSPDRMEPAYNQDGTLLGYKLKGTETPAATPEDQINYGEMPQTPDNVQENEAVEPELSTPLNAPSTPIMFDQGGQVLERAEQIDYDANVLSSPTLTEQVRPEREEIPEMPEPTGTTLLSHLRNIGGISINQRSDITGEKNLKNIAGGYGGIFRKAAQYELQELIQDGMLDDYVPFNAQSIAPERTQEDIDEAFEYLAHRISSGERVLPYEDELAIEASELYASKLEAENDTRGFSDEEVNDLLKGFGNEELATATDARIYEQSSSLETTKKLATENDESITPSRTGTQAGGTPSAEPAPTGQPIQPAEQRGQGNATQDEVNAESSSVDEKYQTEQAEIRGIVEALNRDKNTIENTSKARALKKTHAPKAKAFLEGKAVEANEFKKAAATYNEQDYPDTHRNFKRLEQIAIGRKKTAAEQEEKYIERINGSNSIDEVRAITDEIMGDRRLFDDQITSLDGLIGEKEDALLAAGEPETTTPTNSETAPDFDLRGETREEVNQREAEREQAERDQARQDAADAREQERQERERNAKKNVEERPFVFGEDQETVRKDVESGTDDMFSMSQNNDANPTETNNVEPNETENIVNNEGAQNGEVQDQATTEEEVEAEAERARKRKKADDDFDAAFSDFDSILGASFRNNITPEQEQKLLPVLTRMMDAAFRKGYYKFEDAARYVIDEITKRINTAAADVVTLDYLQSAYIGMSGRYGDQATSKRDVINFETKEEVLEAATNVDNQRGSTNLERDSQDATPTNEVGEANVQARSGQDGRGREQGVSGNRSNAGGRNSVSVSNGETVSTGTQSYIESQRGKPPTDASVARNNDNRGSNNDSLEGRTIEPATTDATTKTATSRLAQGQAQRKQQLANNDKHGDSLEEIREALPLLDPDQQEDVYKAEQRFAKEKGYGMLFTNGTGTGKTYTGMGVIRRYVNKGKSNILIAVPSEKVLRDWVKTGARLGLNIKQLRNTNDNGGSGIVVTLYANLRANESLMFRDWDLFVADEAHYLSQNKDGSVTGALKNVRGMTYHPDGVNARYEALHRDEIDEVTRLQKNIDASNRIRNLADTRDEQREQLRVEIERDEKKRDALRAKLRDDRISIQEETESKQGKDRPRVLMLSATPFAYEKSIEMGQGYLYDYAEGQPPVRQGYNQPNHYERFMMNHFGYRMRTGRLTEPDARVNRGQMQRDFNTWLKREGVLSGRMLEVDADYDRKFVLIESAIGRRIDDALQYFRNKRNNVDGNSNEANNLRNAYSSVEAMIFDQFGYLERRYVLEAIKAKAVVPLVREQLALGRKVVVFHDYKKGGGFNPFDVLPPLAAPEDANEQQSEYFRTLRDVIIQYRKDFDDLIKSEDLKSSNPIDTFTEAFGDKMRLFNGDVPAKKREEAVELFQNDNSGMDIILLQTDAGKEGISLHDTTGEHQRVLYNLGQPTKPTTAIQQEGRVYRKGQVSNAMLRYLNTGTTWERITFAETVARRASTAENLALGEQARALMDGYIDAFEESDTYPAGHEGEGTGGKERDRAANEALTIFDRARVQYFAQEKKTSRTKSQEGADYYATPEPIGVKMVEFADLHDGEKVLEPSAGHGAIARWMPDSLERTAVEPEPELRSRLALGFHGNIIPTGFEDFNTINKFSGIVMNPPFGKGSGGKLAMEHIKKASDHLYEGGRIVALIPRGKMDSRIDDWFNKTVSKPVKPNYEGDGKAIYNGDTVIVKTQNQTMTIENVMVDKTGDFYAVRTKGSAKNTAMPVSLVTQVKAVSPRTVEVNEAEGLQIVADIDLPAVTFERAGTKVRTRILVMEKTNDEVVTKKHDLSQITDIDNLFDEMEILGVEPRQQKFDEDGLPIRKVSDTQADATEEGAAAETVQSSNGETFENGEFKHTKTGETMYASAVKTRVDRERFVEIKELAKKHNGYYSPYRGNGAIAGFLFKSEQDRQDFLGEFDSGSFSRSDNNGAGIPASKQIVDAIDKYVKTLTKDWKNAPNIQVVSDINDPNVAEAVRRENARQLLNGATGEPEGLYHDGKVYLFANQMDSSKDVMRVLFHETLGHFGLNGVFGKDLEKVLKQISQIRRELVEAKADKYGYDINKQDQVLKAAEEVLAEMAQTRPEIGFVKRTIAAIRTWLRNNIKAFGDLDYTDNEIVNNFILPARNFVERSAMGQTATGGLTPAFSRDDFAEIKRLKQEVAKAKEIYLNADLRKIERQKGYDNYMKKVQQLSDSKEKLANALEKQLTETEALQATTAQGNILILAKSAKSDGKWQISRFDDLGAFGDSARENKLESIKEFIDEADVSTITNYDVSFSRSADSIMFSRKVPKQERLQPEWADLNGETFLTKYLRKYQDKLLDLKDVVKNIEAEGQKIYDKFNAYRKEELYHSRVSTRVQDFVNDELKPLLKAMQENDVSLQDFEKFLWYSHAEERNDEMQEINPNQVDEDGEPNGSGISTRKANQYLNKLDADTKALYEELAKQVQAINKRSNKMLVAYGLESQATIDAWEKQYNNYVPLHRIDMENDFGGSGNGRGYSVKGSSVQRAYGSGLEVVDIIANIAQMRERNIIRGEKNRVSQALIGMATLYPKDGFWSIKDMPKMKFINPKTGLVETRTRPDFKNRDNVIVARFINKKGQVVEKAVAFDEHNDRAMHLARNMKNLETPQLEGLLAMFAVPTRWIASVNTQFNPIFGLLNITRDVQGALLNLSSTALAGKQMQVLDKVIPAYLGIWRDLRSVRRGDGKHADEYAKKYERFQKGGGKTGYRDMFANAKERTKDIEQMLKPKNWKETPYSEFKEKVGGWLSDYNEALENAVRLATYETALENGITEDQALSIAKNISVNFNRKGQVGLQAGALYAFFNASIQGTARIVETLRGGAGKKILQGGLLLGAMQAIMLEGLGFEEDEPPEFVRDRNLILATPFTGKRYIAIPMPLGFNAIPAMSRILTETLIHRDRLHDRFAHLVSVFVEATNPLGSAGSPLNMIAPTVADPLVDLGVNKDFTGRTIAIQEFDKNKQSAGHTRGKDSASFVGDGVSYVINWLTGGTDYTRGFWSPTPDQIDYLIGQGTGGIGRETVKLFQTGKSFATGEDLPFYRVPLLGRFMGNAESQSSHANTYHRNIQAVMKHQTELQGMRDDKLDTTQYKADNPETKLIGYAKGAESTRRMLRKMIHAAVERDASNEEVQALNDRLDAAYIRFNERYKALMDN